MVKPRRDVRFSHRNGHTTGTDERKSSFSDISETGSEPGSPLKTGMTLDGYTDVRLY